MEICQAELGRLAGCIRVSKRTMAQSSKWLPEGKIAYSENG
jgi:hypothetical protein